VSPTKVHITRAMGHIKTAINASENNCRINITLSLHLACCKNPFPEILVGFYNFIRNFDKSHLRNKRRNRLVKLMLLNPLLEILQNAILLCAFWEFLFIIHIYSSKGKEQETIQHSERLLSASGHKERTKNIHKTNAY
jgi:hypothetical protein